MEQLLYAGLVNWLATWIIVEGEVFREPRDWLKVRLPGKLSYLLTCQLCAGTWVGLALSLVWPMPISVGGGVGWFLAGLCIKAVGHLILEVQAILMNLNTKIKKENERHGNHHH